MISVPARTSLQLRTELRRELRDDGLIVHVSVEHFDRGAVAVGVDLAQHRLRGVAILRCRCAFRHRELEADREVQLLGVAGGDPQPAALALEQLEPGCGGAQLGGLPDDGSCIAAAMSAPRTAPSTAGSTAAVAPAGR